MNAPLFLSVNEAAAATAQQEIDRLAAESSRLHARTEEPHMTRQDVRKIRRQITANEEKIQAIRTTLPPTYLSTATAVAHLEADLQSDLLSALAKLDEIKARFADNPFYAVENYSHSLVMVQGEVTLLTSLGRRIAARRPPEGGPSTLQDWQAAAAEQQEEVTEALLTRRPCNSTSYYSNAFNLAVQEGQQEYLRMSLSHRIRRINSFLACPQTPEEALARQTA